MTNMKKDTKEEKKLFGRIVHDVPTSLRNKPKPSDKPTLVLDDEVQVKIKQPVLEREKKEFDKVATPDTTVLGLDIDEDFTESAPVELPKQKAKQKSKAEKKDTLDNKKTSNKVTKSREPSKKSAPRNAKLVLERKSNGEIIKITKKDFVIGKSKYSDFQVKKNNTVSRSHIVAHKLKDGSLAIEDNDSKNGTFVDEVRIKAHEEVKLKDGQTVRLSDEVFIVKKL